MRPHALRCLVRRKQLTIGGLLVGVGLLALLVNAIRPISQADAIRIAERRFRAIPGASAWVGHAHPRARLGDEFWSVSFFDDETDQAFAQVSIGRRGRVEAVIVHPPGHVAPMPVEFLTTPLPPPGRWEADPMGPRSELVVAPSAPPGVAP